MTDFHLLGINYKTAALDLRERLLVPPEEQAAFLQRLSDETGATEAGVLITCHRSEWFWSGTITEQVTAWLRDYFKIDPVVWEKNTYLYRSEKAVWHLIRLASGLDSLMLGEPQIFGQLKAAFQNMMLAKTMGSTMQFIFPFVFSVAKKIRTEITLTNKPLSVATAAVDLARSIFNKDLSGLKVLLIGAGETIEEVAQAIQCFSEVTVWTTNRTAEHAERLALMYGGEAVPFEGFKTYLPLVDIIVSATASPEPVLTVEDLRFSRTPRDRPCYIIDLAMPRDVSAEVAELPYVHLYNVDHFKNVIEDTEIDRALALSRANTLIESELTVFHARQASLKRIPEVCHYRDKMQQVRDEELQKALQQLKKGCAAEEVIIRFAEVLTNKLMHHPTLLLKSLESVS